MDIVAKHVDADIDGVRIAELDEMSYRRLLWDHRPLTDFWRVGRGYSRTLEAYGLFTMGDIARASLNNEEMLYKLFGINAELLIDHAWGYEPCTIADIRAYQPESNSISSGQVLHCPYTAEKAKLVMREMADLLVLDLVEKGLVTDQLVLTVGYDIENLMDSTRQIVYQGEVTTDHYGRKVPKHAHGTANLGKYTSSTKEILQAITMLYDQIVDKNLLIRRLNVTANHVLQENQAPSLPVNMQMDFFAPNEQSESDVREKRRQKAMLTIKKKFGKNAILKGMNFEEGATAKDRNSQIGGHKA
jgi:DNA polymerase V